MPGAMAKSVSMLRTLSNTSTLETAHESYTTIHLYDMPYFALPVSCTYIVDEWEIIVYRT